jgi:hypothetical protein
MEIAAGDAGVLDTVGPLAAHPVSMTVPTIIQAAVMLCFN